MARPLPTVILDLFGWAVSKIRVSPARVARFKNESPHGFIVMLALLFLIAFLIGSIFAMTFPVPTVKFSITIINCVLTTILLLLFLVDLRTRRPGRRRKYRRNLANTVLTVVLTIVTMTALYRRRWYDALNRKAIQLSSHNELSPRFPAITFLSQDVHSMAVLRDNPLKCFLGEWVDHAPLCTGLTDKEVLSLPSCDCSDRWPTLEDIERGNNLVYWLGQNSSHYSVTPSESMVSRGAGHILTMQIFFSYNSTESLANSSVTESPGVYIALYDPSYDLEKAISEDILQAARIDANSGTNINVGLRYYEYLDRAPLYKYDLTIHNRPNLDLVCDVNKIDWYPCHIHLDVEIPMLLQTTVSEVRSLTWSSLVAEAGAYFSLVQFLSWLVSGQAWAR